jgi:mannosyl-oligosaccharide glucosidase
MRHECSQHDDIIYGWNMHDGRTFGSQNIRDKLLNLDLTTDFVKVPHGNHGGDWVLRVTGKLRSESPVSVVFYAGSDAGDSEAGGSGLMSLNNKMVGGTPDLQGFSITWSEKDRTDNAEIRSLGIPLGKLWMIKNYAQKFLVDNGKTRMNQGYNDFKDIFGVGDLAGSSSEKAYNVLLFQAVFKKDFQVIVSNLIQV